MKNSPLTKNEFMLLAAIRRSGLRNYRDLRDELGLSLGYLSQTVKRFSEKNYIDEYGLTEAGKAVLQPYRVDSAVIMAAGMSTRFVPLSLEKPKGLLKVKGEVLIERQIRQLIEAGISEIIVVLGYKKEAFFYLEDLFPGIRFIINPDYSTKNNTYTLFLAGRYLKNTYICSSDDYFEINPFEDYVYESYYSAIHTEEKTNEWYMISDAKGYIRKIEKSGTAGEIMLGHAYWDRAFSTEMLQILKEAQASGKYDGVLWEQILADNLRRLPPMAVRVYPDSAIHEFDSLEELRRFDEKYVNHTQSRIISNICRVFQCDEKDIRDYSIIKEGLTNTSLIFSVHGRKYVYRHPGEGTEQIISRPHEKVALELAKEIQADPTYLTMDSEEGWKISYYVDGIRMPDYASRDDSKRVIGVMRRLHQKNLSVDWAFKPWEEACRIEALLRSQKDGIADSGFEKLKSDIEKCYRRCIDDGITARFCHCDTYAPNWMLTDQGETILIDWEYAGNADPGCDVGTYIMDSQWETEEAIWFIREYCGGQCGDTELFHYLAYTAILSFYWYVWALYREACGAIMGESLYNWHRMAKRFSRYLIDQYRLEETQGEKNGKDN